MDTHEKELRLDALSIALEDLDKIIDSMQKNNYSKEQVNEYVKKRWTIWNEIYQVYKKVNGMKKLSSGMTILNGAREIQELMKKHVSF